MYTNIDYWERVLHAPTASFKNLFEKEAAYLHKHIIPGSSVVDIGCGDGRTIRSILDVTQDIVGVDNDQKAVKDAKENLKQFPGITIERAEATRLPFKDKTFDCALLMMTLVNFGDNKQAALQEIRRVIKSHGQVILSVYSDRAINERLIMYEKIAVPIKEIKNGKVRFDESVGAHLSEQFSLEQLKMLLENVGLKIVDFEEVGSLAYICSLELK